LLIRAEALTAKNSSYPGALIR